MTIGQKKRLSYYPDYSGYTSYTNKYVTWESSNEDVATVDDKGNVTAISPGRSIITFDPVGGPLLFCDVTVARIPPTAISLPATSTTRVAESVTLTPTLSPSNATATFSWKSSDESVATVSVDGLLTAVGEGSCMITCSATDGSGVKAECQVTVTAGTVPDPGNHEWVDLGLPSGTLWATCNVGASSPEEYGDYFAWGETEPKDAYNWGNYKWMNAGQSNGYQINKYTFDDGQTRGCWYDGNGNFIGDDLTELLPEDDAATANWGSGWQMPSYDQITELYDSEYTTTEWTTQGGVNGRRITSKSNGNSIFLPAAGYRDDTSLRYTGSYGLYWSRSLGTDFSSYASYVVLFYSGNSWYNYNVRYEGQSVRPVRVQN